MSIGTRIRNKKHGTMATVILSGEMTGVYCIRFDDGVLYSLTARMLQDRYEVVP